MADAAPFFQTPPELASGYSAALHAALKELLPAEVMAAAEPDLRRFADRVVDDVEAMGRNAEANPPRLVQFDAWGRRVDHIEVAPGWKDLERVAAEEGLVALGYERPWGEFSRIVQFAKLYLFTASSAIYTCPLAMTDGAARVLELLDGRDGEVFGHLTSRDPATFWTSGQWMTERAGGSDVGRSGTVATRTDAEWTLEGDKWFTSATTSQVAMTLARTGVEPGTRGLSLFLLHLRGDDGLPNRIRVHRLKEKLGTKALPTAELSLDGTPARLIGEPGRGVPNIAVLFNITRIYNAVSAVSYMRRAIDLATNYAQRREAFGKKLIDHPLHAATLADMELEWAAGFHLTFETVRLLGRDECGTATADESAALRLLTPLAKLFTAKQAVAVCSEALECFGGAGYVEDTGLPRLLRDAQVLTIWEGTTNVLSLDVLRAISREQALEPLLRHLETRPAAAEPRIRAAIDELRQRGGATEADARRFSFSLARTAAACLIDDAHRAAWLEHPLLVKGMSSPRPLAT